MLLHVTDGSAKFAAATAAVAGAWTFLRLDASTVVLPAGRFAADPAAGVLVLVCVLTDAAGQLPGWPWAVLTWWGRCPGGLLLLLLPWPVLLLVTAVLALTGARKLRDLPAAAVAAWGCCKIEVLLLLRDGAGASCGMVLLAVAGDCTVLAGLESRGSLKGLLARRGWEDAGASHTCAAGA